MKNTVISDDIRVHGRHLIDVFPDFPTSWTPSDWRLAVWLDKFEELGKLLNLCDRILYQMLGEKLSFHEELQQRIVHNLNRRVRWTAMRQQLEQMLRYTLIPWLNSPEREVWQMAQQLRKPRQTADSYVQCMFELAKRRGVPEHSVWPLVVRGLDDPIFVHLMLGKPIESTFALMEQIQWYDRVRGFSEVSPPEPLPQPVPEPVQGGEPEPIAAGIDVPVVVVVPPTDEEL